MAHKVFVSPEFARLQFKQMRAVVESTRSWSRNVSDLAIRLHQERMTPDENLEFSTLQGERRLALNQQAKNCLLIEFAKEQEVPVSIKR